MSDFNIQFEENDQHITLDFKEAIGTVQSVNGKIGDVVLDAGDLEYDDTETYSSGSVGDELSTLKEDLAALEGGGVPTNVRQALKTLLESAAYADTGLTDEMIIISSWASAVTAITLNQSSISISGATTSQLTATTTPSGGTVTWSSSNTAVATVSSSGLVTGVSNGTATITATSENVSATCTVTVSGIATLSSISAVYTQTGTIYDTDDLDDILTAGTLVVTATYSDSSTSTVASTDYTLSGTLTTGTSTITVSYGGKTTTFTVTVSAGDPLPSDYTRAEYVYFSAGSMSFVNTGVTPSENGDIGIDITFMQTEDNTANHYFVAVPGASTSATIGAGVGVSADNTEIMAFNGILSSIKPNGETSVTGEKISVSALMTQTSSSITDGSNTDSKTGTGRAHNYPIYLWGMRRGDNTGYLQYPSAGRIYSLVVTDDGTEIINLIPCTRNSDNKVGFYNAANGDFITFTGFTTGG